MKFDTDIEIISIDRITPYERNAKTHPQLQVERLAKHIAEVGWDQPIVVDKSLVIIKGHGRYLAAKHLGLDKVPIIVKQELTPQQIKAVRLADNKLAESPWDAGLLEAELLNLDIPMIEAADLGFEMIEPVGFEFTPPSEPTEPKQELFKLTITFDNEEEQELLFNELRDRGLKVKV